MSAAAHEDASADARDLAAYAELLLYYLNSAGAAGDPARREVACAARDVLLDLQGAGRIPDEEAAAIVAGSYRTARRRARRLGERVSGWRPAPRGLADLIGLATAQIAVWARTPAGPASGGTAPPGTAPNRTCRREAAAQ